MENPVQTHNRTELSQPVLAAAVLANAAAAAPAAGTVRRRTGAGKFPIGAPDRGRSPFPAPIQFGGK
jgi:hypothetical protein